jgi:hypothetical protein
MAPFLVSGLEPERTNAFLVALYEAATTYLHASCAAVSQVLSEFDVRLEIAQIQSVDTYVADVIDCISEVSVLFNIGDILDQLDAETDALIRVSRRLAGISQN